MHSFSEPKSDNITDLRDYTNLQNNATNVSSNGYDRSTMLIMDSHRTNANRNNKGMHKEIERMTNMDILEKYIDKMDRDQSDLREDIRASENRMEKRIERLEQLILNQTQETENKFEKMEEKIDARVSSIENKFDSLNKWMMGTCIATILGIAGMVWAIIQVVQNI